jgi:hypothetical protein
LTSFPEVLGYEVRPHVGSLRKLAEFTLPSADKYGAATGAQSGLQIGNAVSDHIALVQGCVHVLSSLLQQSNLWLAAPAGLPELWDFRFWMVEAIIHSFNRTARLPNRTHHRVLETLESLGSQMTFGDSRLIGNNRHLQSHFVQKTNGLGHAREQLELRRSEGCVNDTGVFVIDELVDHTIAIEQNRFHVRNAQS